MKNPLRIARRRLKARYIATSSTPIGDALAIEMGMLDTVVMLDNYVPPLHRMTYEQVGHDAYAVSCESCDRDDIVSSPEGIARIVAEHSLEQVKANA
jgi:hypothetical protein